MEVQQPLHLLGIQPVLLSVLTELLAVCPQQVNHLVMHVEVRHLVIVDVGHVMHDFRHPNALLLSHLPQHRSVLQCQVPKP